MVVKSYTLTTVVNYFFNYFCKLHFLDFHRQAITHHAAVVNVINATWYSTWKAMNAVVKCKQSRRLDCIIAALLAACQPEVSHSLFVSACITRLPPHDPRYQDLDTVSRGHAPATLSASGWSSQLSQPSSLHNPHPQCSVWSWWYLWHYFCVQWLSQTECTIVKLPHNPAVMGWGWGQHVR